ncbi:MAG: ATP-grasp domain-containing protein [Bdellovibrionales bacterium]|nr:ATP-grasp domain-containing protein [Bdellovibrionales bacterium]
MSGIKKVAVAARGEIAKRILSTCHQMGLDTVLLYASGDEKNEAFRWARERVCIGPEDPRKSYLNIQANVEGALSAGVHAIHPGYGFLSESADFAKQCEKKGLIFIGPSSSALALFGNKISARSICEKKGIPVLPGWSGSSQNLQTYVRQTERIGYPVMIKAADGGGGRGLRLAHNEKDMKNLIPQVKSEIQTSFSNQEIFLEKYLESARHIEIQVFVSADGEIYIFGDRDCSLQRRHQKIIEEAPSHLPEDIKKRMKEAALSLLSDLNYKGAGTLEFLFKEEEFFFLEMNTRLQVEHTVTEMIFGVDLVRAQILTALGQPAFLADRVFTPLGHSIQCRICAEDPFRQFLPAGGNLLSCLWPDGPGKRVDRGFGQGDPISSLYDSLIAKLVVWDISRSRAIEKMKTALEETIIFGCTVNIPFLRHILCHPDFIENRVTVDFVEKSFPKGIAPSPFPFNPDFMNRVLNSFKPSGFAFNPWRDFKDKE